LRYGATNVTQVTSSEGEKIRRRPWQKLRLVMCLTNVVNKMESQPPDDLGHVTIPFSGAYDSNH
jgi:hypothetical protein